jgi:hypothetical protein
MAQFASTPFEIWPNSNPRSDVTFPPLLNQPQNTGRQTTLDNLARINNNDRIEITILRMKMRRVMIVTEHGNNDS